MPRAGADHEGMHRFAQAVPLAAAPGGNGQRSAQAAPWTRSSAQVILSIEGRTASAFVPRAYDICLHDRHDLRRGAFRRGSAAQVGQLHFFGLEAEHEHMQEMHRHGADEPAGRDVSFVLRADTRAHLARLDPGSVMVTFRPIGMPGRESAHAVRRVALFVR
jgi:tyrosinase